MLASDCSLTLASRLAAWLGNIYLEGMTSPWSKVLILALAMCCWCG